jgi:HK97 family phage portal protein
MKIFGFEITRTKAAGGDFITHVPSSYGWWPVIRESFAGAWQRHIQTPVEDALAHPTFWSCVTLISGDVAKCRPMLVEEDANGIETEIENPAYSPVLRRPNHYQNRIQFYTYWMLSKLTRGNTYALKERDARGVVTALYLLDPTRVKPLVGPNGDVYYALQQDVLAGIGEASIVVPAREIIHDIAYAPYHPLCGVSPVYACGHAAMQALTIQNNATKLFRSGSQTGGILTAPGVIGPDDQKKLEDWWTANYTGPENIGKVAVLGGGLKFEKPTAMSFVDAQLIDQLKWDDEKICAVLHVPGYKVNVGALPSYNNVEALGQEYYGDCLQIHFESLELCLTEGLELKTRLEVEFDLEALKRMDSVQKMDEATKGVVGGVYSPNEARAKFNLKPVKGGDTPYLQQQNWSLAALNERDKAGPPPGVGPIPIALPPVSPPEDQGPTSKEVVTQFAKSLERGAEQAGMELCAAWS